MARLNNYKDFLNDNVKLVSIFKNNYRGYIQYECNIHGIDTQRMDSFSGCRSCNKLIRNKKVSKLKTHSLESVRDFVKKNSTAEFMSSEYTKQSNDYWFRCECGNGFRSSLNSFKQKNKKLCEVCSEKIRVAKRRNSDDEIISYIKKHSKLKYLNHYIKNNKGRVYVVLECECGKEIHTQKNNLSFFKIEKCEECRKKDISDLKKLNKDTLINRLKKINLTLLDNSYNGQYSDINLKCNSCGFEFTDKFTYLSTRINICPNCSPRIGKGSKKIYDFLKLYNIEFETEYWFEELKYASYLKFDYFLPKYNILIEFDGEFHYLNRTTNFVGIKSFFMSKKRDYLKNKFCRDKNIKLIRIPYFEIDTINKYLKYLLVI